MNVITLQEEAFYELVNKIVAEVRQQLGAKPRDKWLDGSEAMEVLRIKSKTTLQKHYCRYRTTVGYQYSLYIRIGIATQLPY